MIIFWDVATWRPRYPPQQTDPEAVLINLTFTPDSSMVAAAAFDGVVRLWDVQTGELLPDPIPAYTTGWVLGVCFDPSGKLLATGGADGVIKLWDVASRQLVGEPLVGHSNRVMDLTFSPDGKVLASAGSDGTIRFWNVAEGTPAGAPLTSSSAQVWSVVQTPGEPEQITALSGDGSIAWWNAVDGELLRPLLRTGVETEEMKVAADGRKLYLASTGAEALAVTPVLGDWEQAACEMANRSLTEDEWTRYMYTLPYDPVCQ
jgi:WD40 repeat protein